jgi:hypothetical protein
MFVTMFAPIARRAAMAALALGCLRAAPPASADVSKEACIDAHSRGQDAKDQGKLSLARKLFLTCAQAGCPALVQGDCARFADDLGRMQPSLSFVARDAAGHDLPNTTVYVDDILLATRLDDGKAYDVDPGRHAVKFSHDGKDQVVTVVVGAGEKSRMISVTFGAPAVPPTPGTVTGTAALQSGPGPTSPAEPKGSRPTGAKVLIGAGAVMLVGGAVLGVVGLTSVPGNCSLGSHECAAPPGDPSFDDASGAVTLMNVGFIAAGVGAVAAVGGLVWYMQGGKSPKESKEKNVSAAPWLLPGSAGFAISGRL